MTRTLLDTSILIDEEIADPVPSAALSVVSLGELRAGVLLARQASVRTVREARLVSIRTAFDPLPVDEPVADRYGEVLTIARAGGRTTKATDLLIIATAAATGRTLLTRDKRQASLGREFGITVQTPH